MPETLMVAMTGRRLGDVVEGLPADLAGRTIHKVEYDDSGDGTEFTIDADYASVQRILSEWQGALTAG